MKGSAYRRFRKKCVRFEKMNTLKLLRIEANAEGATTNTVLMYKNALNERNTFLKKERERVALYRQKKKTEKLQQGSAPLKNKTKDKATKKTYTYYKDVGKVKTWKRNQRNYTRLYDIKTKFFTGEVINARWMIKCS